MEKVYDLLRREPVRAYAYSAVVAIVALLAATGVVTASLVPLWLAVASAVLAVPAVEKARHDVVPVGKLADEGERVALGEGRDPSDEELEGFHPEA